MNIRARYAIMKMNSTTNGDFVMPVSYDKLWKMLIDKKMNRTDLKEHAGIALIYSQNGTERVRFDGKPL